MTADLKEKSARHGVPLIDGIEKVTGRARYTADLEHSDALVGRILRSPVSHGDIIRLDVLKARALTGVAAVITGDDCPYTFGVLPIAMNEFPLARGRVRYRGEPVAAVAAIDAKTAERALELIELEVQKLPAYYTSETARAPDALLLHHNKPGNIERDVHHQFGDVAQGFARADLVPEVTITAAGVYWHPVGAEDADLLVTRDIFPLSEAFAAVRRALDHEGEHANKLARIFNCA